MLQALYQALQSSVGWERVSEIHSTVSRKQLIQNDMIQNSTAPLYSCLHTSFHLRELVSLVSL